MARYEPLDMFRLLGLPAAQPFCPYSVLKRETPSPMNFPPIPKPTKLNTRRAVSKPLNTAPCLWLAKKRTSLRMY